MTVFSFEAKKIFLQNHNVSLHKTVTYNRYLYVISIGLLNALEKETRESDSNKFCWKNKRKFIIKQYITNHYIIPTIPTFITTYSSVNKFHNFIIDSYIKMS